MAAKNENNQLLGLSFVGVVAIVAIFGIVYMSQGAAQAAPSYTLDAQADTNLAGQALSSACIEYAWSTARGRCGSGDSYDQNSDCFMETYLAERAACEAHSSRISTR